MLKDLTAFLAPFLIISGWYVVNEQNNKREERKECRSLIDKIKELLLVINDESYEYFCVSRSKDSARKIKASIDILEIELGQLPRNGFREDGKLMSCLNLYVHAITGGNFESASIEVETADGSKFRSIVINKNYLIVELENFFSENYREKSIFSD